MLKYREKFLGGATVVANGDAGHVTARFYATPYSVRCILTGHNPTRAAYIPGASATINQEARVTQSGKLYTDMCWTMGQCIIGDRHDLLEFVAAQLNSQEAMTENDVAECLYRIIAGDNKSGSRLIEHWAEIE